MTATSEMTIGDFLDVLASNQSTPGGGGASALTGSQAAALVSMVIQFTIGKKKYAPVEDEMRSLLQLSESLRRKLAELADRDVEAFNAVVACYGMPKESAAEKSARTAAMQKALRGAMAVSVEISEASLSVLELAEPVGAKGNSNVVSDAATGAFLAYAAIRGALINVHINLKFIKDDGYVTEWSDKSKQILEQAEAALAKAKAASVQTLGIEI